MIATRTTARAAVVAAAIGAGLIAGAGSASASPAQDDWFIDGLQHLGMSVSNPQQAVQEAQLVCVRLESGTNALLVINQLGHTEPGLDQTHLQRFVGSAMRVYCPQIAPSVVKSVS